MYEVHGNSIQSDQSCSSAAITMNTTPYTRSSRSPATSIKTQPKGISIKAKWPAKPPAANKEDWTKNIEVHQHSNGNLIKFSNFPIMGLLPTPSKYCRFCQWRLLVAKQSYCSTNDNLQIPDTAASRG